MGHVRQTLELLIWGPRGDATPHSQPRRTGPEPEFITPTPPLRPDRAPASEQRGHGVNLSARRHDLSAPARVTRSYACSRTFSAASQPYEWPDLTPVRRLP